MEPVESKGPPIGMAFFGLMSPHSEAVLDSFIALQAVSPHPATAIVWGSFGYARAPITRYVESLEGRENLIEIHFSNEAGRRNGRLGPTDFALHLNVPELNRALEDAAPDIEGLIRFRVREIKAFVESLPHTTRWVLSLGLESNYTLEAALNLLAIVEDDWHYEIAYNPLDHNCDGLPDWVYCETHTASAPPKRAGKCLLNMDGQDAGPGAVDLFVKKATDEEVHNFITRGKENNCITLLWSASLQGVGNPFVPTLNRHFSISEESVQFFSEHLKTHLPN